MSTLTASRVLAPKLVRPIVLCNGLIGYPHMSGLDYERGAEWAAVRSLRAQGFTKYWHPIHHYGRTLRLYVIAPRDFDAHMYHDYLQSIADGKLKLGDCGFAEHLAGLVHDGGSQSGPHGNADGWLDFTKSGNTQNAVFWSFSMSAIDAVEADLNRRN